MFSTNAQKVGELASAQVIQYNLEGVTPVIKHFPGLGSIKNDTHTAISKYPHSLSRLCKIDLKPFRLAITAGATALMVGHGVYPSLGEAAASGNARILKDLLRTEMRYEGIIVTDSMSMDGATAGLQRSQNLYVRSLKAGVDVILMPGNPTIALQGIKRALETGKLSRAERRESIARLIAFRLAQQRVADAAQKFPAGSNFLVTEAQWFALDF
jgi:beta-N-acetylhexosaminidase